ncbi:MAG: cysteine desulfurase [Planctomycetes bacterium]|nr:cysteine desulfurase [Planctomycetota bacterium]
MNIYLDHAATTRPHPRALAACAEVAARCFGNPSSVHPVGREARRVLEEARARVAFHLGGGPDELIFTGGGTESDNLAVLGLARAAARAGRGRHVITAAVEHHAVLHAVAALAREGCRTTVLPVDNDARVRPADLAAALAPDTALVSIRLANNELGTLAPIAELARLAHEQGALFHTDAVQALGKLPIRVCELGVDALSVAAHKAYGPKGVGALWLRAGTPLEPLTWGGAHERGLRPGTENVPGAAAFAAALDAVLPDLDAHGARMASLRDRLQAELLVRIPGARALGATAPRVPNVLSLLLEKVAGEAMVLALGRLGISVSSGSACMSATREPSHVLRAIGLTPDQAACSIRFSLGIDTTAAEIAAAGAATIDCAARLRALAP